MTKLHSVRLENGDSDDLRARVHFDAETGQIWLHEHRMLLVHAEAQALLRKELIDTLGMDRARGLLMRMGYDDYVMTPTYSLDCLQTLLPGGGGGVSPR